MIDPLFCLEKIKDVKCKYDLSASKLSSIKCGGNIALCVEPATKEAMVFVLDYLVGVGAKFRVLGRLTNTLVSDGGYCGVVVKTDKLSTKYRAENLIYADCGCTLGSIIKLSSEALLGGGEGLAHIPGSIGGAVYGNAGAFGDTVGDIFVSGNFYSTRSRCVVELHREELDFSYRHSRLSEGEYILLDCVLRFQPASRERIFSRLRNCLEYRRSTQPIGEPSLGSVFKRCGDVGAGLYIDGAGLRGFSYGGAEISSKHAGFIVNRGGATAAEVVYLISLAKQRVYEKYGVLLEEEINYLP